MRRRRSSLLVLWPVVLFALVLALAQRRRSAVAQTTPDAAVEAPAPGRAPARAHDDAPPPDGPRRVFVGLYLHRVPQLDLANNSYLADFWIWMRWQGDDIDPSHSFEFLNLYESWDVAREPVYVDDAGAPRPERLDGGWRYQVFHMHARFGHAFDVRAYPFDRQQLEFAVEDNELDAQHLVYVPDTGTRSVDPQLVIPGWLVEGVDVDAIDHVYQSNFGDPRRTSGADHYSRFRYRLRIGRPLLGYAATTLLPIAIVMLITLLMFLIESRYFEGRLGLGITSLLSAVALQLTSSGNLPKTGYLVLLDHVYNLCYATILLALLESVIAVRWHDADRHDHAKRLDRASLVALTLLFFGGVGLLVVLR